jgi:hypothetical protein
MPRPRAEKVKLYFLENGHMDSVIWEQRLVLAPDDHFVCKCYIYCLLDATGQVIYVGSSVRLTPQERLCAHKSAMKSFIACGSHSSPLTRGVAERGIDPDTVTMKIYRWVQISGDSPTCDVVLHEESAALAYFRHLRCPLLQKNSPIDTSKQAQYARAFRERNPDYMKQYCREWRQRRKAQEQQNVTQ